VITWRLARWQLPTFFLLAFVITWAAQIPAYTSAQSHGFTLTNEANLLHLVDLVQDIAQGIYGFLPWIVALFLLKRYGATTLTGREQVNLPAGTAP
jgi:hypothetical protein